MGVFARIGDAFNGNWSVGRVVDRIAPGAAPETRRALITHQNQIDRFKLAMGNVHGSEGIGSRSGRAGGWKPSKYYDRRNLRTSGYDIQYLRGEARRLAWDNPHIRQASRILVDWSVGTGFNIAPKPAKKGTAKVLEPIWKRWFVESNECDIMGETNFHGLTRLLRKMCVDQGEGIVRLSVRPMSEGLVVPLQIQLLEPDFFYNGPRPADIAKDNIYDNGKEFTPDGKWVAAWLLPTHPEKGGLSAKPNRVPVIDPVSGIRQLAHIKDIKERPGENRAYARALSVYNTTKVQADLRTSLANRKRGEAKVNWFLESPAGDTAEAPPEMFGPTRGGERFSLDTNQIPAGGDQPGDAGVIDPDDLIAFVQAQLLDDNTVVPLPPGWKRQESTIQNVGDYKEFMADLHRTVAAGMGVPYMLMTGDLKGTTYSSGKIGFLEFRKECEAVQDDLILNFCQFVWNAFVRVGNMAGLWRETFMPCVFRADRFPSVEPEKDAAALIAKLNAGLISLKKARLELGEDPEELAQEIAEQIAEGEAIGVSYKPGTFAKTGSPTLGQEDAAAEAGEADDALPLAA